MPSESEHRLDALLRAWAKKRREEAGKGFELHPATRRLLLDEVKRSFPEREREREPWRLVFSRVWTRTVGVVGFAVVLVVVGWAARNLWTNLPRVGDMAMNEANPPEQFDFTLRKRQAEETNFAATAPKNEFDLVRRELAKEEKSAPATPLAPDAAAKQKAPADADAVMPEMPFGFGRRTASASRSGTQPNATARRGNASDPFAIIPPAAVALTNRAFSPLSAPALATGGVVALTESLARKPAARSPQERQAGTTARDGNSALGLLAQSPGPPQLRALPAAPAAAAPKATQLGESVASGAAFVTPKTGSSPTSTVQEPTPRTAEKQLALADKVDDEGKTAIQTDPRSGVPAKLEQSASFVNQAAPAPVAAQVLSSPAPTGDSYYFARSDESASPAASTGRQSTALRSFARGAAGGGARYAAGAKSISILSRFELKQEGPRITLLDADGSVYQGEFVAESRGGNVPAPAQPVRSAQRSKDDLKLTASATGQRDLDSLGQSDEAMPARQFQVAGTNRSLNQPVVIIATLVAPQGEARRTSSVTALMQAAPAAPAVTPARPSAARRSASPPPASLSFDKAAAGGSTNVFRIQGRFRIGTNAEESLEAVRTP